MRCAGGGGWDRMGMVEVGRRGGGGGCGGGVVWGTWADQGVRPPGLPHNKPHWIHTWRIDCGNILRCTVGAIKHTACNTSWQCVEHNGAPRGADRGAAVRCQDWYQPRPCQGCKKKGRKLMGIGQDITKCFQGPNCQFVPWAKVSKSFLVALIFKLLFWCLEAHVCYQHHFNLRMTIMWSDASMSILVRLINYDQSSKECDPRRPESRRR